MAPDIDLDTLMSRVATAIAQGVAVDYATSLDVWDTLKAYRELLFLCWNVRRRGRAALLDHDLVQARNWFGQLPAGPQKGD